MKFAFCLFKYFPFGGLQRDFLRIAKECIQRGHEIDVYTMSWEGEKQPELPLTILPARGWQNHTRCKNFALDLKEKLSQKNYDLIIGFNKIPGLDVYYAADTCFKAKIKNKNRKWYQLAPRYRHLLAAEKAVFERDAKTEILLLASQQQKEFVECYQTPLKRFHLLPPGIAKDRIAPENAGEIRKSFRAKFNLTHHDFMLLMIGSGFKTKGLDRILLGLASLPDELKQRCHLFIIGKDNEALFKRQAKKLNITHLVHFLGGRDDVPQFLLAADLLLHPAYNENTGTVLLESLASGLPVLTTDVCGYAHHIERAEAGKVLSSPFQQSDFNNSLQEMLISSKRKEWRENALNYAKNADIYDLPKKASDLLEVIAEQKKSLPILSFKQAMQLQGEVYRALEGRRTLRVKINDQYYFIKQHKGIGWKEIFKNIFQGRLPVVSAKNEWCAIKKLNELNIHTLELMSYGRQGLNPAKLQSYLLTKELDNAVSLEDYSKYWLSKPPAFSFKKRLIEGVAHIAKTLHENGINHRDFYICHFLLKLPQEALYLIDLHRAQIRNKTPVRWIIKDLAGLYFSSQNIGLTKRDWLRFIKIYRALSLREILNKEMNFWQRVKTRGDKLYQANEQ